MIAAVTLVGLAAAVMVVPLPLLAVAPGSVIDVGTLVQAEDQGVEPGGTFFLTTVRLSPVTTIEAVQAWLHPEVDLVGAGRFAPSDLSGDELRRLNLEEMDSSKRDALAVAFEALGYDAVSGGGAEVVDVVPGTPAEGALVPGDLIVGLDGERVTSHYDVLRLLAGEPARRRIELEVQGGDGATERIGLTLAPASDQPRRAEIGVTLRTRAPRLDLPVDVDVATERIGGPSAGLAFALELLDQLSEGDLTRGRRVAATGTIGLDGSVGTVGGVGQKAAAVDDQGIDVFLVPRPELVQARRLVGDVRVEPVDSLADALRVLTEGEPALVPSW